MSPLRVLVTGGTGFVGSRVVEALVARGDRVRVLHRASSSMAALDGLPVEHCLGDILDPKSVEQAVAGCDLVFHVAGLAAYWRASRDEVYRVNVEGSRVVMQACLQAGTPRVVHTSSVAAIGFRSDGKPADEETAFDPISASFAYGDSKHRAEAEVLAAVDGGLSAVIVNPAVVIGAGDHNMISGSALVEFARGHVPASPPGGACMVDVDAVVQGHLAAAERGRAGERYILGGENLTHRQTAEIMASVTGRKAPRLVLPNWSLGPAAAAVDLFNRLNPRPPKVTGEQIRIMGIACYYDSSKAVRELSFALLPLRDAVEKAYRWYLEHGYV